MTDVYTIVWKADTSKCLGVKDQQAGAPVGLWPLKTTGATIVWNIDFTKNVIFLNSSGGQLALDFQGGKVGAEVPLVLSEYNGTPSDSQRWTFLSRPGFIVSMANTSLVVDDKYRGTEDGTPVWGYPFNGSPAQQWKPVSPFALLAAQ